jgi:FKBP-type peptidyl-prolyl cis-trans isomerase FkpA
MIKKFFKPVLFLLISGIIVSMVACNPAAKYEKNEREAIANYLNTHSTDTFTLKESGLYYRDVTVGTDRLAQLHDTAYVIYTGKYLNGTVFDTNVGGTKLIFPVGEGLMIQGFDEGIMYMRQGGTAQFLVPSKLAYGTQGYYSIAGYTPLLYEVQLVKVAAGPAK